MDSLAFLSLLIFSSTSIVHLSSARPETQVSDQQVGEHGENNTQQVCYDKVGCFYYGPPWTTTTRYGPKPKPPTSTTAEVHAFTKHRRLEYQIIKTYPEVDFGDTKIDTNLPTIMMVHGFFTTTNDMLLRSMMHAYLNNYDGNVLVLNWEKIAFQEYSQSMADARVAARLAANVLKHLIANGLPKEKIHLMGHSAGAHVAAYIANEIPGIGRLTGLDPSSPFFQNEDPIVRLDASDALFVDVVHTGAGTIMPHIAFAGPRTAPPVGHVDFYVNGGEDQPFCKLISGDFLKIDILKKIFDLNIIRTYCNHVIAMFYMGETMRNKDCTMWAHRAIEDANADNGLLSVFRSHVPVYRPASDNCTPNDCIPFGYDSINSTLRGVFYVKTRSLPPFCLSEKGP